MIVKGMILTHYWDFGCVDVWLGRCNGRRTFRDITVITVSGHV